MTTIGEMPLVDFNDTISSFEPPNLGGYVVAVGSPFTGLELYGPPTGGLFASFAEAEEWRSDIGLLEDSPFDDGPSTVVAVFNSYPA